jgi:FAD/FMN-containing dehydrogenase
LKILFAKSRWELPDCALGEFLSRIKRAGFDASELYLPVLEEPDDAVRRAHGDNGLLMVAQVVTGGGTPAAHRDSLERLCARATGCGAARINCHTGADWFSFAENVRIFRRALELEKELGIAICHETHRGRALFNAPDTLQFLAELPSLRLTADFSHWQVVHETDDLVRQAEAVDAAVGRAWHIHARVGCAQAPQVADPRAPEFAPPLEALLDCWRRILRARSEEGADFVAITPEFGPPPYQPVEPASGRPLADPWEINLWMHDHLRATLAQTA